MAAQPLCFVLMPFGRNPHPSRPDHPIDFDSVWRDAIEPAIQGAGMVAIREDQAKISGVVAKPIFEKLLLCEFAIADLSIANPNVLYGLGVRNASRQNATVHIFADDAAPPFDAALVRALPYRLRADNTLGPGEAAELRANLTNRLTALAALAQAGDEQDSPVFQLVTRAQVGNLPARAALRRMRETNSSLYELLNRYSGHEKTDIFREMVAYSERWRRELMDARQVKTKARAIASLNRIRDDMRPLGTAEAGAIVDLYLSYRALGAFDEMIALYEEMPAVLQRSILVREQLGFALNRRGRRERAVEVLRAVIAEIGENPESNGLLGRVYKDYWQEAAENGRSAEAHGYLQQAIEAYTAGFRADWRDPYPGINAVTLLDIAGNGESLAAKEKMIPVVRYGVEQRIAGKSPDYWDYATLLELEVLNGDRKAAAGRLSQALARVRESWEPETTAKNLGYIRDARRARGGEWEWVAEIVAALREKCARA